MDFVAKFEYDIRDIWSTERNLHTIHEALPTCRKKGETGMLYYTIQIDDKTWEMLEKICKIKNLTPDQLIKRSLEKVVEKEYLDIV